MSDRVWIKDEPGFYATRLVKCGAEVGVEVRYGPARDPDDGEVLDRSSYWTVTLNGEVIHCDKRAFSGFRKSGWPLLGRPITEAEYLTLLSIPDHLRGAVVDLRTARPGVY